MAPVMMTFEYILAQENLNYQLLITKQLPIPLFLKNQYPFSYNLYPPFNPMLHPFSSIFLVKLILLFIFHLLCILPSFRVHLFYLHLLAFLSRLPILEYHLYVSFNLTSILYFLHLQTFQVMVSNHLHPYTS